MQDIYIGRYASTPQTVLREEDGHQMFKDVDALLQQGERVTIYFVNARIVGAFLGGFAALLMEKYSFDDLTNKLYLVGPDIAIKALLEAMQYARRMVTDMAFRHAEIAPISSKYN